MAKHSFTFKFSFVLFAALTALAVQSCMPRGTDEASTYMGAYVDLSKVDYTALSNSILLKQCNHCHGDFATPGGLAQYYTAGDPDHSPLYTMVLSGKMPQGGTPLPSTLVQMIRIFIENQKPGSVTPTPPADPVIDLNHVTYDVVSSQIVGPRCVKCHQDMGTEAGLQAYLEPGNADSSIAYNYIAQAKMPLKSSTSKDVDPLSTNNVAAVKVYIESLPPKTYPPLAPTWESIDANLIQRSCIQCHRPGGKAEKEPFDTYQGVVNFDDSILQKMQSKKMPPAHSTTMPTPEVIQAYIDWMKNEPGPVN